MRTMNTVLSSITLSTLAVCGSALAAVPTYDVEVIATYDTTTTVRGASEAGHVVGDQVILGQSLPFVATLDDGLVILPLPTGYNSGAALGVNNLGVVVGTVSDGGFAFDLGEPAIWTPDGAGGYTVAIPQQFTTVSSPLNPNHPVSGGQAVAINDAGQIVGWSRLQGFQGGPTTQFSATGAPVNLGEAGFAATVRDISETGIIVGGQLKMDLQTQQITNIGVPDPIGSVGFSDAIAFAVNDLGELVAAANLASVPTENYLTYIHNDIDGYIRLNESQLPSRFVGFYDNNNLGDVSASGGVLFRAEDALFPGFDGLLDPSDANWDTQLGFIGNDRRVYTTAIDVNADQNAIVVLVPQSTDPPCPADFTGDGLINADDLFELLGSWGACPACPADLDGSGAVNADDLFQLLGAWGDCL